MRFYFTCGPQEMRLRVCAPLEYDEPDPAPDFDDDECDDDEYGPIDGLVESIGLPVLNRGRSRDFRS